LNKPSLISNFCNGTNAAASCTLPTFRGDSDLGDKKVCGMAVAFDTEMRRTADDVSKCSKILRENSKRVGFGIRLDGSNHGTCEAVKCRLVHHRPNAFGLGLALCSGFLFYFLKNLARIDKRVSHPPTLA